MLLTRILTAVAGIPFILACIYSGNIPFYVMMFIISSLCVQEYLMISKKYNPHTAVSLAMAATFFVFLYFFKDFPADKVIVSAIVMIFVLFGIEIFGENPTFCIGRISSSFLGAFFIPLALMHMVYIRNLHGGMKLVFFIFIVIWILDTMAYAFGKALGKHKLANNISPNKTLEGAIAGIVFGVLAAVACRCTFMSNILTLQNAIILGLVIAVSGQFSDLAESLIKRDGNVKDSGKVVPGHGGVFDRFDSYLFTAPVAYYVLQILK
ncbi:phosphatidate cytidylyltransferase [Candidatus Endomicrobiellum trichonymphae]|uniref:Phosphatidate cytidylyltransferase n=1 Tax=Endomicrobium trichonymphae TaxID=1408204 RepID=B1H059_ENDTX|nr:phosphatidate cytidylyltransferase [Candidatus Endomicrobium trichonymphae]BAG13891.1 phosphatidate cytidylyltransferase [Candidatus Endomicrobium trichonymphae]